MKKYFKLFGLYTCLLLLLSSTCKKEGNDCHYYITFKNNSTESVIFAVPIPGNKGFTLDGFNVLPGQANDYRPFNNCIESRMNGDNSDTLNFFVVNPDSINTPNQYYPGDSIEYYNDILATYYLSLPDLNAMDFTINYP